MPLRGVVSVMATPFSEDESLDEGQLGLLVEWSLRRGVHGLVILGISGEVYKLSGNVRDFPLGPRRSPSHQLAGRWVQDAPRLSSLQGGGSLP